MNFQIHVIDGPPWDPYTETTADSSDLVHRHEFIAVWETAKTDITMLTRQVTNAEKEIHDIKEYLHLEDLKRQARRQLHERLAPSGPSRAKVQQLSQGN